MATASPTAAAFVDELFSSPREGVLFVLASGFQTVTLLPVPALCRHALDSAIPQGSSSDLLLVGLAIVVLAVVNAFAVYTSQSIGVEICRRAILRIRSNLLTSLTSMPISRFHAIGDDTLHARVLTDVNLIEGTFSKIINQFLPIILPFLAILVLMVRTSPELAGLVVALGPLYYLTWRVFRPKMTEAQQNHNLAFDTLTGVTAFLLEGVELLRVGRARRAVSDAHEAVLARVQNTGARLILCRVLFAQVQTLIGSCAGAAVMCLGGHLVFWGSLTIGDLGGFLVLTAIGRRYIAAAVSLSPLVLSGLIAARRVDEALSWSGSDEPYTGQAQIAFTGTLDVRDLAFGYEGDVPVIRSASLRVTRGEIVVLQGENGAGKSTLLRLLLGFYRPWSGEVRADEHDFEALDLQHLREQISYLPQDVCLMPGTIRENVLLVADETYGVSYSEAVRLAGLEEIFATKTEGDQARLAKSGRGLSGGQQQRVSLARSMVGDPKLLILDEPTNHLDGPSIRKLIEGLQALKRDRAILVVSHHPWLMECADRAYRLEEGQTTELPGPEGAMQQQRRLHGA